jgi:hypothetical protein
MADIFSDALKFAGKMATQALTGDNLRDYRHASKLFVADNYRLSPKYGFLFHVAFDINPNVGANNPTNPNFKDEIGMLVKSVSLPKFNIDVKKYNAYNRPNFVQTKINYETINIAFHDDSADVIRNFWFDYYNYYYRDADYSTGDNGSTSMYTMEHKYQPTRPTTKWGYTPRNVSTGPYLNAIRIYSLHQKRFSEYILINPIIKSFRHGEHAHDANNTTMQHDMAIEYESVLYYYGTVSKDTVNGFVNLHYDTAPSPLTLAGGSKSIFGAGGILESGGDIMEDVRNGNWGAAIFKAGRTLQTAKGMDLGKAAIGEILSMGTGMMRDTNPNNPISVPSLFGSSSSSSGGSMITGLLSGIGGGGGSGAGGSAGGWLAGVAGLGAASLFSSRRSSEVTAASADESGFYPESPYQDLPSPTEEDVLASMQRDQTYSGEPSVNDQDDYTPSSNQGSMNAAAERQEIDNNIKVADRKTEAARIEYTNANQLKEDAEGTRDMFQNRYDERLAAGEDPESFRMRNLQKIIGQQNDRVSEASDALTAAQQKYDSAKDLTAELKTQKSNLG